MKRIRALTEAERALWKEVAATVTPRVRRPAHPPSGDASTDAAPAHAMGHAHDPRQDGAKETPTSSMLRMTPAAPAPSLKPPPLAPIERRLKQRLSRGQREVDARIDLHGLRQDEAHAALTRFIGGAHARGAGLVLVVTGKGGRRPAEERSSHPIMGSERGVLHRLVPLWLADPDMRRFVIGFEQAAQGHGGGGALYVRIRRAR